jgi:hypothetical protein
MVEGWALIIGIALFLYLCQPFLRRQTQSIEDSGSNQVFDRFSDLHEERERSYTALAELDFDYDCGKLSEGDYLKLRSDLLKETAVILAQLDQISASERDRQERRKRRMRDSVEEEIERYKRKRTG